MKEKEKIAHCVSIRRVAKVGTGGKTFRSSVAVVVGDEFGKVGFGLGKATEISDAIKKATKVATKKMIRVELFQNRTVPYDLKGKFCKSLVYIKRAKSGTGVVAGGSARYVFDALGVKDVVCKVMGSNPINNVKAVIAALNSLKSPKKIALMRSVSIEKLFYKEKTIE